MWRSCVERLEDVAPFAEPALDTSDSSITTLLQSLGVPEENAGDDSIAAVLALYHAPVDANFLREVRTAFANLDDRVFDLAEACHCSVCAKDSHVACNVATATRDEPWWSVVSRGCRLTREVTSVPDTADDEERALAKDAADAIWRRVTGVWTSVVDLSTALASRARHMYSRSTIGRRRAIDMPRVLAAYDVRLFQITTIRAIETLRQLECNVQRALRSSSATVSTSEDLLGARRFLVGSRSRRDNNAWTALLDTAYGAYATTKVLLDQTGRGAELRALTNDRLGDRRLIDDSEVLRRCMLGANDSDTVLGVEVFVRETVAELNHSRNASSETETLVHGATCNDDEDDDDDMPEIERLTTRSNQLNFTCADVTWPDFPTWIFAKSDTYKFTYLYAYLARRPDECPTVVERARRYATVLRYRLLRCMTTPIVATASDGGDNDEATIERFEDLYRRVAAKSRLVAQHETQLARTMRDIDRLHRF